MFEKNSRLKFAANFGLLVVMGGHHSFWARKSRARGRYGDWPLVRGYVQYKIIGTQTGNYNSGLYKEVPASEGGHYAGFDCIFVCPSSESYFSV